MWPQSNALQSHIIAKCTPVAQPSCLHTESSQISQPFPSDVQTKTCSKCLGMFAISPQSNRVIWRPDFGVAKVTSGSESGFGQKAGSVTINSAVGVVCLLIPGHLPVCMSRCCASCTPSSVSNHPIRKRDVEQRERQRRKRWKRWCQVGLFQHSM